MEIFQRPKSTFIHGFIVFVNIFGVLKCSENIHNANNNVNEYVKDSILNVNGSLKLHQYIVEQYYRKRENWTTSTLGTLLFKNCEKTLQQRNKTFLILIWKHWGWLKNRHVYRFGVKTHDPLEDCSVSNCHFTGDDKYLNAADAVLVHLQKGLFPQLKQRNLRQRWIFLNDEAPPNTYTINVKEKPQFSYLAKLFNWSMTYRSDADVPVPYGRTVPLNVPKYNKINSKNIAILVPHWKTKKRDVLITILMSHCSVAQRMRYLRHLNYHMKVDIHGKCSSNDSFKYSCPGHFTADCHVISKYLFYLVMENAMCRQYMTEKLFHNAYSKGAIPIIWGPPLDDCKKLLPPNSFLHVDSFATPKDLAIEIKRISKSEEILLSYHTWRIFFRVSNEHGYFRTKSYHLCRLCEALNYNDNKEKQFDEDEIRLFLDEKLSCSKMKT